MILKSLFDHCEMPVKCTEGGGESLEEKWTGHQTNALKGNVIGEYFLLH